MLRCIPEPMARLLMEQSSRQRLRSAKAKLSEHHLIHRASIGGGKKRSSSMPAWRGMVTFKRSSKRRMTSEEFLAELETLDVGVVKQRLASGAYLRPYRHLAQGWVEHKEAIASAEQMALARQAVKDAKWANWIALWALVIAAISLIVAVVK